MTDRTVLHAQPGEWELLLRGAAEQPPLHPGLRAAWERLRSRALSFEHLPEVSEAELRRRAAQMQPSLQLLDSMVDTLGEQLPLDRHRAVLTDSDAVILWACGGAGSAVAPVLERLKPGVSCDEALVGPNAMGTCVALRQPVVVVGEAHALRPFRVLDCCAAPVLGPAGNLLGVVNVSGPTGIDTAAAMAFAAQLAQHLGASLSHPRADRVLEAHRAMAEALVDRCAEPALLFDATGGLMRANAPAQELLRAFAGHEVGGLHDLGVEAFHAVNRRALQSGRAVDDLFAVWPRIAAGALAGERHVTVLGSPVLVYALCDAHGGLAHALVIIPPRVAGPTAAPQPHTADPAVEAAREIGLRSAPGAMPLLILGEPGTGRRRLAQELHTLSGRAGLHLVECQGAGWRELERQLFGGGRRSPGGLLRSGSPDTIVLHALEELPAPLQSRLQRWLSESRVLASGGRAPRIICTSTPDLKDRVEAGTFRMDLYAMLSPRAMLLPPLAQRRDKAALVHALLTELAPPDGLAVDPELQAVIEVQPWPGNVTQLREALAHAVGQAGGGPLRRRHLVRPGPPAPAAPPPQASGLDLDSLTERALREALLANGGNVSHAAKQLGIARSTMYRMLERFGLR